MYPVSVTWLPLQIMTTKLQKTDKVCTLEQTVENVGSLSDEIINIPCRLERVEKRILKMLFLEKTICNWFSYFLDDSNLEIVNYGEETSFLLLVCWVSPQSISSEIA